MNRTLLSILSLILALVACAPAEPETPVVLETVVAPETAPTVAVETATAAEPADSAGLPNPASVYCEAQGYDVEMREGPGGTYGICLFPDGSECDEWAYLRGECQPGDSLEAPVTPAAVTVEHAADGCLLYQDDALGFTFHYPADATIEPGADPLKAVNVVGPLADDEHWPMFYVSYPRDVDAYRPPEGVDLPQWLIENNLLPLGESDPPAEVRQADVEIAGTTAVHTRFERSPHSYAYDKYFFTHGDQLFVVVIVHTGDREDWALYNHFLQSFDFVS